MPPPEQRDRLRTLLQHHGLHWIAKVCTQGGDVAGHFASFCRQVEEALPLRPVAINSDSGVDTWHEAQSVRFFDQALAWTAERGIAVAHETHRGRILFHPGITARLLNRFASLQLCCDFSHWVCVCERLLEDQDDLIAQCAQRALHVHARVGDEEGPQVPDPRAPEYQRHVEAHERWWEQIWQAQRAQGRTVSTLTPEFGPPPYLHTLPHTNMPVAALEEVCDWQAQRQAQRFAAWLAR